MQNISKLLTVIGLFLCTLVNAQQKGILPASPYASPLDIPLLLSANYAEYRSGHFHAGLDFKTQQVEGKRVFSIDSGYVYRVVVLTGSYGNAVYIKHPSGNISLYGHLSKFEPRVAAYVKEQQYKLKSYTVDLFPEPGKIVYRKNELIGLSGNSGSSFGAHLHFEIRDSTGAIPLNPLNYGFSVSDKISPRINWLMVYPLTAQSAVNGLGIKSLFQVNSRKNDYFISPDTILVRGSIGLGIESYDFLDNSLNECSPYTIEMLLDDQPTYFCRLDSIPFEKAGYINSYFDYSEMIRTGKKIQKLFKDPNNDLAIYKNAVNRGTLQIRDTSVHSVRILVKDTYGNESVLSFHLRVTDDTVSLPPVTPPADVVATFRYDSLNVFEDNGIRVVVPKGALFDHVPFRYSRTINDSAVYSAIYHVNERSTPLLNAYVLSIKPFNLPAGIHHKAVILNQRAANKWVSEGGEYKNGYITLRTKSFGRFMVAIDTVAPIIRPAVFKPGAIYKAGQTISFIISDDLAGIGKYGGYIDKNWALFEYDAKNNLITYTIDPDKLAREKQHQLEIIVTDNRDNVARFRSVFYY